MAENMERREGVRKGLHRSMRLPCCIMCIVHGCMENIKEVSSV